MFQSAGIFLWQRRYLDRLLGVLRLLVAAILRIRNKRSDHRTRSVLGLHCIDIVYNLCFRAPQFADHRLWTILTTGNAIFTYLQKVLIITKGLINGRNFFYIEASGVEAVVDDDATATEQTAPIEYYNLTGVRANEEKESLASGIYIVRQGISVKKIVVK